MGFKFRTCWAFLVLSLITIRSEEKQNNDSTGYDQNYGYDLGYNLIQDYGEGYNKTLQYGKGYNQSYDGENYVRSLNYPQYSTSYGPYLYGSSNYSYHQPNYNSYQRPNYNQIYQQSNYGGYNHSYNNGNYNTTNYRSPYQTLPGLYDKNSYNKQLYTSVKKYSAHSVYGAYLASGAYLYQSSQCNNHYGQTPQLSSIDMENAFSYAHKQLGSYEQNYGNSSVYSSGPPVLLLKEKEAILMEYVTEYFAKYKCLSKYQTTTFLPAVKVGNQYISNNKYGDTSCYSSYGAKGWSLQCPDYNSKYRSHDGSCNNRYHPYWGKSFTCHIRLLPPDYSDGIQSPRLSSNGQPLPNPRTLSNILAPDLPYDAYYVLSKVVFGQFLNHDITRTPVHGSYAHASDYSGPSDCCKDRHHKQCYPIDIPPSPYDYQYRNYKNTCMNFIRAAPCPLCDIGPRQQMNTQTSFIDASVIYGNSINETSALRTYKYGLLETDQDIYGKPILPSTTTPYGNHCNPPTASMKCFVSGDSRANQHPAVMAMHTIFVRRHNEHVTALLFVNPHWNDETLFQEGKRILIAEFQHISFNEYMPLLLGPTLMNYYSLNVRTYGYTNYEPYTDPSSWNDYATAACRFGHTQIPGWHSVPHGYGKQYNASQGYWLRDQFFNPSYLWKGEIDGLIRGWLYDKSKSVDPFFSTDIKNYLFKPPNKPYGIDLYATNVHRGRDCGLPGYVHYLKYCFGYEVYSWNDLNRFIPAEIVAMFRQLYESWLDIDLYTAGVTERHFVDADIGPTFACILGIQYYHVKFGDRYYYEHGGQSGSFNLAQLDNIRSTTTMARLLCRSSDYLDGVQRYAFFPVSNYNPKISCKSFPEINYNLWKENY